MEKTNLELFKQALSEGLSEKIDSVVESCTEEIVCSEQHELAMRAIIYGKTDNKRICTPKMKRIIAILVAVALLLTSCGIIFRNEIREIFEDFFVKLTYSENDAEGNTIKEVYELTHLPDGYYLEEKEITPLEIHYKFINKDGDVILFDQFALNGTYFVVDTESGYSRIEDITNYEVYFRLTNKKYVYVWNNGSYSMSLTSSQKITNEEIILIINGIKVK